ncbi:von Willebrand factor A domain-containing protein 5A-like isoform X2 [Mustelus asterias]
MERRCGLLTEKNVPVPLKSISVEVEVKGFVADVSASLEYQNEESNPVEAIFVFPMDSDAAVYNFQATIDGKTIVAEIKEKEEAKDEYDDAISAGGQAFLLEEDTSSSDIFTCTVGNLPPAQNASVSFSFVQELPIEADGAVRFVLPTILNPRYTPDGSQSPGGTQDLVRVRRPPYTLAFRANVQSPLGISRVQSNCGLSPLEYLTPDKTGAKLSLTDEHRFDKDVELLIYYDNVHTPSAVLEAGVESAASGTLMGDPAVMVNIYPRLPETPSQVTCGEFIFLMDRSGSMGCQMSDDDKGRSRIQSAKDTLLLLLKSLPMGCYFNIYGFGSTFKSFFPESVEYNQESMQKALEDLKGVDADMGGTEILNPLSAIYRTPCKPGHPRQLFVFTDGEVSNTKMVIAEVRRNSPSHRCFSFGIGQGASTELIKGIAKAASGSSEFITGKDRMQAKVLQSLKFALQPAVTGLSISWELPPGLEAVLLSQPPTVIFSEQRAIIYAQLKGKVDSTLEAEMTLKYSLKEQTVQNSIKFSLQPNKTERSTVHHLAAKTMIEILDSSPDRAKEKVKKHMIDISTQANVISPQTAFIAVNKDLKQPLQGPLIRRDIPSYRSYSRLRCRSGGMPRMKQCYSAPRYIRKEMLVMSACDSDGDEYELGALSADFAPSEESDRNALPGEVAEVGSIATFQGHRDEYMNRMGMEEYRLQTPVMKLISQQNADGSWSLSASVESLLGLKPEDIKQSVPGKDTDLTLWVTVLAVIWLHAFGADTKDEWELLVAKSLSWIKANAASDLGECVKAGNALVKASVDPQVFGL